ncbi:MAG: DUF362 domain-containing protein [Synergistaceae bacterium]|jgi:uncharacterized protein (DUF362 family)|nr:DUF362 domain-containing protein [Synergistaceae bacterium]
MMDRDKIFVAYGSDGLEGARRLLEASGAAALFEPGMRVGLKPNLVVAKPASSGATTSPQVVAGVVEFLRDLGVRDVTVMEGAWAGDSTVRAWQACGYRELEKKYGVRLQDLKSDKTRGVLAEGLRLEVCVSPLEVDRLVNMPVLKGHCQTMMTCALKNLKGCLPDSEKRRFHSIGLHKPIAALNTVFHPDLILVDSLCGDITFEEGGNPVEMNRLILGTDPVKVDAYGASLLGIPLSEIEHLTLAERMGVGSSEILPDTVTELSRDGQQPLAKHGALPRAARHLARHVDARNACSICYAGLIHALYRLDGQGAPREAPNKIHIGQGFKGIRDKGVGVGDCAGGFETRVRGCPPKAEDILRVLRVLRGFHAAQGTPLTDSS